MNFSFNFNIELISPKAYGSKYACFKGQDVIDFMLDDDAFDSVSLISVESGSDTSSTCRKSSRLSINSNSQTKLDKSLNDRNISEKFNLDVEPCNNSSPGIMKTPKRKLSSSSGDSSHSSKKCRTEPRRRSVSFAKSDFKPRSVSKINKQKVVPTVILKKVEDKYFSFRNQTPESVEKPKTRRSLGETFISYNNKHEKTTTDTPKKNRSLRQRR